MQLFETEYRETKNGYVEKIFTYKGEELATKSDVYEWYLKGNAYTDSYDIRSRVAIGISIASIILSFIASIVSMVS